MDKKSKSVAEVIELLKKLPQDLPVWTEGCDCWGTVEDIVVEHCSDEDIVLIKRPKEW